MQWVNAFSTRPSLEAAVQEVAAMTQQSLHNPADLALVFISAAYASDYPRLMPLLREYLNVPCLLGCGGGGIIGSSPNAPEAQEVEQEPALSLALASLPDVQLHFFHLEEADLPDLDSPPDRWTELIGVSPQSHPQFILLADPIAPGINDLLQGLDFAYPESSIVGGLASGGMLNRGMSLFGNYQHYQAGVVGLALSGNIVMDTIVAQGCRPIGQPFQIAQGQRNIIVTVDNGVGGEQAPLQALQDLLNRLPQSDRTLAQDSLFIGVARDEFKQNLTQGDFLIRNLLGLDPRNGAIAIGDRVRPGSRVQFHLRDAQTSAEDLASWLQLQAQNERQATGALMFSCLGRGEGLYGQPNFESQQFNRYFGDIALSGFFANGEIGPVAGSTFLHGYTSVFGIFRSLT
ncbi:MAG: FIST N-terminal domain-containing protein [Jaaginema sp. PMC 1079.18]|nr:FIST N-terminal domain-containing protein [Jaaginema sp. PMC 1080.18]MEC4850043.1 FIST N-terminal domain-containing protein [Jaaginema sp. PMC 1079.18]MEC4865143.1 FIST N-terminal domain-containing protein [Jaaginema sp. PMC 1078.18]